MPGKLIIQSFILRHRIREGVNKNHLFLTCPQSSEPPPPTYVKEKPVLADKKKGANLTTNFKEHFFAAPVSFLRFFNAFKDRFYAAYVKVYFFKHLTKILINFFLLWK